MRLALLLALLALAACHHQATQATVPTVSQTARTLQDDYDAYRTEQAVLATKEEDMDMAQAQASLSASSRPQEIALRVKGEALLHEKIDRHNRWVVLLENAVLALPGHGTTKAYPPSKPGVSVAQQKFATDLYNHLMKAAAKHDDQAASGYPYAPGFDGELTDEVEQVLRDPAVEGGYTWAEVITACPPLAALRVSIP